MWWLKRRFKDQNREQGASGVLVALMMLVLIGAGAMAVDAGQIYAERAELQNGADAGALAAAQVCATNSGCTQASADAVAKALVDENSKDGVSNVRFVDLSVAGEITVSTSTIDGTSNAGFLTKMFANALNTPPVTVGATATAALVPPSGGGGFPLALSDNCWDLTGATTTGVLQKISWKPGVDCTNPSGHTVPGGWGWLDDPDDDCDAVTTTGNVVGSDPGSNPPDQCEEILQDWINTLSAGDVVEVPFPVFDSATGTGNTGDFHIIGYATFSVVGWKFGQNGVYEYHNTESALSNSHLACSGGPDRCIIGQFVTYVSIEDFEEGSGPGDDLGTLNVVLIK